MFPFAAKSEIWQPQRVLCRDLRATECAFSYCMWCPPSNPFVSNGTHEVLNFWNSRNLKSLSHILKLLHFTQLWYKRKLHNSSAIKSLFARFSWKVSYLFWSTSRDNSSPWDLASSWHFTYGDYVYVFFDRAKMQHMADTYTLFLTEFVKSTRLRFFVEI